MSDKGKEADDAIESLELLSQQAAAKVDGKSEEIGGLNGGGVESAGQGNKQLSDEAKDEEEYLGKNYSADDIVDKLGNDDLKFPPPSPRTAQLSAELGRKGVGVLKYLELHQMIITCLEPNVRGERDFKTLCNDTKSKDPSVEMGRLLKNLRQEVKKLYGERRKRKQLVAWDQLEQAVGIRAEKDKRTPAFSQEAVLNRAFAVEQLVSKWFMDRTLFDEHFVRELSVHLVGLLARGEKSPGSVLSMPRVVLDKIIYLHIMKCKDRFHELHRLFFSDLFTPADIEIAVLSGCNCMDCIRDWGVKKIEMRLLDPHVRFHWTQEKAKQAAFLLRAHLKYGNDVAAALVGMNAPKMRSWSEADFKSVLRNVHTCASCFLCQMNRVKRPAQKIDGSLNQNGSSSQGDGSESKESSVLDFYVPLISSSKAKLKFKRLKDTCHTRPLGPKAKRKIRDALAEQTSKFAKTTTNSSLSMARNSSKDGDDLPFEITNNIIEQCLTSSDYLRKLVESGVLEPVGVQFNNEKGELDLNIKETPDLIPSPNPLLNVSLPKDIQTLSADQVRELSAVINANSNLRANVEKAIRTARVEIRREEDGQGTDDPSGDWPAPNEGSSAPDLPQTSGDESKKVQI